MPDIPEILHDREKPKESEKPEPKKVIRIELNLPECLEYRVERFGHTYIAGAKNFHYDRQYSVDWNNRIGDPIYVYGDVYLDRCVEKEGILWKPTIKNPFRLEKEKREARVNEFLVKHVKINDISSFEGALLFELTAKLAIKYDRLINRDDADAFFRRLHDEIRSYIGGYNNHFFPVLIF